MNCEASDERIEIWYLITSLDVGGAERTLINLVSGLDCARFAPTIWTITEPGTLSNEVPDDVPVRSLDASFKGDVRAPIQFFRAVRAEKPDIIQSFLYFDNFLASLSGLIASDIPIISGVREVPNQLPLHRDITSRLKIHCSDHIISNSEAGQQYVIDRGAAPDQVSVVRNGRDVEKYAEGVATSELYEELGLDANAPIVGTVGRLVELKGHYDLLDGWPQILEKYPDAQLLLIGDGPEKEGLEHRAEVLDCADSVIFAGERDDVPDLLDAMDIFVFPSHYEGLPGALMEAMIAGLPIVATPVDGNAELIEDEVTGLFIPVHDGQALADCLMTLLSNPERRRRLSTAANEYATEMFPNYRMVSEFTSIYHELMEISKT